MNVDMIPIVEISISSMRIDPVVGSTIRNRVIASVLFPDPVLPTMPVSGKKRSPL
jgi:hypothetical protein